MVNQRNLLYAGALLLTYGIFTHGLNPDYIPKFLPDCRHWDSCRHMRPEYTRYFTQRNCECDRICTAFKDCYIDAKARKRFPYFFKNRLDTCLRYGIYDEAIYVVGSCPPNYNNSIIAKRFCEGQDDFSDPMMSTPVSDVDSASSYRNRYCAICNEAPSSTLKPWEMYVRFHGSNTLHMNIWSVLEKDIIFNHDIKKLGIYEDGIFSPFEVVFQKPDSVTDVRPCRVNLISSCPSTWRNEVIAIACHSYMGVVHHGHKSYRNVPCAICNGVDVRELTCSEHIRIPRFIQPDTTATLLLINNLNQMEYAGRHRKCRHGLTYDRFRKICRDLTVLK